MVFVGQFSAGKSSIIKMLTGEDVAIGAAITTQSSTPYEWNGLEIIDTPGIETEIRPDHDEITYEQINHAALLVFVITNEGFSQRMDDHFRTLAITQKRAANMVLVVNKMGRTSLGNVPEQQQVIYEDLKKVTTPYDPKDLYLSFTDAESYLKAMAATDPRRKERDIKRSGHDTFVANLNRFVAEKGVLQKIDLPLNTIAAEIRKAAENFSVEDFSDLEELRRERKILVDSKQECLEDIDGIKREAEQQKAKNNIISGFNDLAEDIGRELSNNVRAFMTQNVDPIVAAFDEKIKAVESAKVNEKIKSEKLSALLRQTENLIGEIQACK